jgi:hypothetical protein
VTWWRRARRLTRLTFAGGLTAGDEMSTPIDCYGWSPCLDGRPGEIFGRRAGDWQGGSSRPPRYSSGESGIISRGQEKYWLN